MRTNRTSETPTVARSNASPPAPDTPPVPTGSHVGMSFGTSQSPVNVGVMPASPASATCVARSSSVPAAAASAPASWGNAIHVSPSADTSTTAGSAKIEWKSSSAAGTGSRKKAFSNTMKSGPGRSSITVSSNATTTLPPKPSDATENEPSHAADDPGGPSTIPGSHWAPKRRSGFGAAASHRTTRSGRQSIGYERSAAAAGVAVATARSASASERA